MNTRTIILLSAPRCGSTAVFEIFKNHPDVYALFEPNFWNFAVNAIEGNPRAFIKRCSRTYPFLEIPSIVTEEVIFNLWDSILRKHGPVVFDKTPFYLGDRKALDLLKMYRELGNDVRVFALIRDPRDAITSQHELWRSTFKKFTIARREARWLDRYSHLEELKEEFGYIPLFRYEDISQAPECYIPMILHYCGLINIPQTYDHIKPISVGRYTKSINLEVRRWKMSFALKRHLVKYGYMKRKEGLITMIFSFMKMLPGNIHREILSVIKQRRRVRKRKRRKMLFE